MLLETANKEVDAFKSFTSKFSATTFILIQGNHDRLSIKQLEDIGVNEIYHTLQVDPICFSHHFRAGAPEYCIVGHVHPGVSIKMPTKRVVKFPCFVVTESEITLPAFSRFTGLATSNISANATCFAFYEEGIFEI